MRRKACRILLVCLLAVAAGCQYGPKRDSSRFKSAALISDGRAAFTFHDFVYRPAKGIAAFPDGGIPKYLTDRSLLCVMDRSTGKLLKLMEEENREWSNGSGVLYIVGARGSAILVSQSGQRRDDLSAHLTRHHLLNLRSGNQETFDLAMDLRGRNREPGAIYMIDDEGALLINTLARKEGEPDQSEPHEVPELWVRRPGGVYLKAARTAHYQETRSGEVVYWDPSDRNFYGFNIDKKLTRALPDYRIVPSKHAVNGVSIGSAGKSLEFGVQSNGVWRYTVLPVDAAAVRSL